MAISGITTKKLNNGELAIMVRFKYLGKTYPIKNFTKLFGCNTPIQAQKKLNEVKLEISKGNDPFNSKTKNLNYYFYEAYKNNIIKKTWKEDTTAKNYLRYYKKNIENQIGWKKLSKITYADLDDILKTLKHTKGTMHNMLKKILNPIFKDAIRREEINKNPAESLIRVKEDKKEKITNRTLEDSLTMVKKLYAAISKYNPKKSLKYELNVFLYLLLLTAHRYGELIKLTTNDIFIDKNLIISPTNITKTKEDYYYPIPPECLEYFESMKNKKGLLFPSLKYSSVADYFKKLVSLSKIEFLNEKSLTPHDTRSLLLNVMIRNCNIDSRLGDFCLEHRQSGVIEHYLDFSYEDKKLAFEKYWNIIKDSVHKIN